MSMSFSQQKRPRSGDHLRTNGLVALLTRKQTLIGPNVAPLANSWRPPPVEPPGAITTPPPGPLPLPALRPSRRGRCSRGAFSHFIPHVSTPPPPASTR